MFPAKVKDAVVFFGGAVLFAILYLLFYPPVYAFRDEASYLSMAYVLKQGKFFIDQTSAPFQSWISLEGRRVFDYPLGMPLFLVPFISIGWQAAFAAGLTAHLAGAVYFRKVLRLFQIDHPVLPLLYLFYPAFIFYSRTIMSDIPAAVFFLAGVYYYFRTGLPGARPGLCFGLSLVFRPTNLVFILPFAAGSLWKSLKAGKARPALAFAGTFGLFLLLIGLTQYLYYGSPFLFGTSQRFSTIRNFSLSYLPRNLPHYLTALMISYPLMALAPFAARKTRQPELLLSILSGAVFFSFYYFHDRFETRFQTFVLGARFLFPAAALYLLMYAEALQSFFRKAGEVRSFWISGLLCAALLFSSGFIHFRHQEALKIQAAIKETIYRRTPEGAALLFGSDAAEFMQEKWGKRHYIDLRENNLRDYLKRADFQNGVYLIDRSAEPGKEVSRWIGLEEIARLQELYRVRQIAGIHGIEIYQVDALAK